MSDLLNDPKFKAEILEGYEALGELLDVFEDGTAGIHKQSGRGGFVDVQAEDLSRVLDSLTVLRTALNSLIVGKDPGT